MITKWKLSNFKCFSDETELSLGRLTILAGPNNGGKSSIIQSILLICQSVSEKAGAGMDLNGKLVKLGRPIEILHGSEMKFGLPAEEQGQASMKLGWVCGPMDEDKGPTVHVYNADNKDRAPRPLKTLSDVVSCDLTLGCVSKHPFAWFEEILPIKCSLTSRRREDVDALHSFTASWPTKEDDEDSSPFHFRPMQAQAIEDQTLEVEVDEEALAELMSVFSEGSLDGCAFKGFLPSHLKVRYDRQKQLVGEIEQAIRAAADESRPPVFLHSSWRFGPGYDAVMPAMVIKQLVEYFGDDCFDDTLGTEDMNIRDWYRMLSAAPWDRRARLSHKAHELLDDSEVWESVHKTIEEEIAARIESTEHHEDNETETIETTPARLPGKLMRAVMQIKSCFSWKVRYLGPLRDEPIMFQPVASAPAVNDVGTKGEFAAALFHQKQNEKVAFIPPENFAKAEIKLIARIDTLRNAADAWLRYLGVGECLFTVDGSRLGHSIGIKSSPEDIARPLTSVGVGASQVIPILIMSLLTEADTTLIFEQPELNLHPRAQSRLADFFLSIILMKKQCLVETHSEYLLDRLHMRVAALDGVTSAFGNDIRDSSLASLVKCYFVAKLPGGSQVREIPTGSFSALAGWPGDFYDDSQREIT